MDWGTMVAAVQADAKSLVSSDDVKRAICDAIRHHAASRFWWTDAEFSVDLPAETLTLAPGAGLPSDLREIVGDALYLTYNGEDRAPMYRISSERMQRKYAEIITSDQPSFWDWWAGTLRVYPQVGTSGWKIVGRYVRDVGTPLYRYASSAWVFRTPDDTTTLTDSYTSDWFKFGRTFDLIRYYTLYILFKTVMRQDKAAEAYLMLWNELRTALQDEYEAKDGPTQIEPWP